MKLYGVKGSGSGIVEAMLCIADVSYELVDVTGFDEPGVAQDRLGVVNPLLQVPVLELEDGSFLTQTAAIALWLGSFSTEIVPTSGSPTHVRFLRLLVWLVASVYPTFTYRDYPERWAPSCSEELAASTDRHRERLLFWLDAQIVGPFVLGDKMSALDCYLLTMVQWRPRGEWFRVNAPKIAAAAAAARLDPRVRSIVETNGL